MIKTFYENTVFGIISNNYSFNDDVVVKDIFHAASKENYITFVFQVGLDSILNCNRLILHSQHFN